MASTSGQRSSSSGSRNSDGRRPSVIGRPIAGSSASGHVRGSALRRKATPLKMPKEPKAPRSSRKSGAAGVAVPPWMKRRVAGAGPSGAPQPAGSPREGAPRARVEGTVARPSAQGAAGDTRSRLRIPVMVVSGALVVGVLALVLVLVLSRTPLFSVVDVEATGSQHVSSQTISELADVPRGSTLLNLDEEKVSNNLKRNPWVKSVSFKREFPSTLGISVEERKVLALVIIGSGSDAWALGEDGVWIEPIKLDMPDGGNVTDAALSKAQEFNSLVITGVPTSVDPQQGAEATDDTVRSVMQLQSELSADLASQAALYDAPSASGISLVLKSGLEVSLGSASDISDKEAALGALLDAHGDQLTYANVRVPSKPSYRKVGEGSVKRGSGVMPATTGASKADAATGEASEKGGPTARDGEAAQDEGAFVEGEG